MPLPFQGPRKIAVLGFEFAEGQKVTAFVFDFLAFDELLAKVPYPFIHDAAGGSLSCAQSRVFCAPRPFKSGRYRYVPNRREVLHESLLFLKCCYG